MRNLIIVIILLSLGLMSCEPSMQSQDRPVAYSSDTIALDTISTIQLSENTVPIVITITDNEVQITSGNVNTIYAVETCKVFVKRTETGLIEYIQVNNDILFKENAPSGTHIYRYLDNNKIEITQGNTINGIISDHQDIQLTRRKLYDCNPFLKKRGLQVGDIINLDCN